MAHQKRRGRKAGQGKFARREKPFPEQVDETKVGKLVGCPHCGSRLRDILKHEKYVSGVPQIIKPVITCYVIYNCYCADCHKRLRTRHPEQSLQATGSTGLMAGPRANALAADLKHRLGGSYGKLIETLNHTFGCGSLRWTLYIHLNILLSRVSSESSSLMLYFINSKR